MTQQIAAVRTFKFRIGIREVFTDISQTCRTQKGITQGMNQHIPIRMCQQPLLIGNRHAPQHHMIARAKFMNIKTVANTH